jgi:hypothetical protein
VWLHLPDGALPLLVVHKLRALFHMSDLTQLIPGLPDHVQRNILRLVAPSNANTGAEHVATLGRAALHTGPAAGAACLPLQEALPGTLVAGASITDGVLTAAQIEVRAACCCNAKTAVRMVASSPALIHA